MCLYKFTYQARVSYENAFILKKLICRRVRTCKFVPGRDGYLFVCAWTASVCARVGFTITGAVVGSKKIERFTKGE